MKKYLGSCLCEAILFEVSAFEKNIGHCHCTMCQKFHGAAFSTFAEVKIENLLCLQGTECIKSYTAPNKTIRKFCGECGSSLFFSSPFNEKAKTIEVALTCLNSSDGLQPNAHIYMHSKVPWLSINDDLPKYKEYREE